MRFIVAICLLVPLVFVPPTAGETEAPSGSALVGTGEPPPIRVLFGFSTRYFDEGEAGRVEVRRITPGGAAERADLRPGDVITTVNGVGFRFENEWDWMRSLGWADPGVPIELGIRRGGESLAVELVPDPASPEHQRAFAEHLAGLKRFYDEGHEGERCTSRIVEHPSVALDYRILAMGGVAELILFRDQDGRLGVVSDDVEIESDFPADDDPTYSMYGKRLDAGQAQKLRVVVIEDPRLQRNAELVGRVTSWPPTNE